MFALIRGVRSLRYQCLVAIAGYAPSAGQSPPAWLALALLAVVACAPAALGLADSPTDTIVVGDQLFWREASGSLRVTNSTGSVAHTVAVPPADGACAGALHTNSRSIYWRSCGGQLWGTTLQGKDPAALSIALRLDSDFAVDENNVYFTDPNASLVKQPLSGMAATPLASGLVYYSIAPYNGDVYLAAGISPFSCPPDTTKSGIYRVTISGGDSSQLVSDPYLPLEVVVDASGIYWSSTNGVKRAQLDGTAVTVIDPKQGKSLRLVNGRLFWNDGSTIQGTGFRHVLSAAIDGTDKQFHYATTRLIVGPAVDATRIYVWESDAVPESPPTADGPTTYHLVTVSY